MSDALRIVVVGAGPRGISVLDRAAVRLAAVPDRPPVEITLVDPFPPGGRIWRRDQPPELLMNTLAAESTVFSDPSHGALGGYGPDLWAWAQQAQAAELTGAEVVAARELAEADYAPRFLFGAYLHAAYATVLGRLPAGVQAAHLKDTVVDVRDVPGGTQSVRTAGGTELTADVVVLATGHTAAALGDEERRLQAHARATGGVYGRPSHPTESPVADVPAGADVLVRGMALNFFDVIAMLTVGRGGRFERDDRGLRYVPSGAEPVVHAGSRRGIAPYSRVDLPGLDAPVRFLGGAFLDALLMRAPDIDFRRDVWPMVVKEATWTYYARLLDVDPGAVALAVDVFRDEFTRLHPGTPDWAAMIERAVPDPGHRLDLPSVADPLRGLRFDGQDALTEWMIAHLDRDVRAAGAPTSSPRAVAAAALRGARARLYPLMVGGGLSGESYARDVGGWFGGLLRTIANGPPRVRTEQLAALARAGVVRFLGAGVSIAPDGPGFLATSASVPGARVRTRYLIDAFVPRQDLRRSSDPLWVALRTTGGARPYRRPDAVGPGTELGAVDVHAGTSRVVTAAGRHPARHVLGVLTEGARWNTALVSRKGTCSRFVIDTDAVARAIAADAARSGHRRSRHRKGAHHG